ncbi:MAG: SurA N-terminal domain-containing protein [Thalassolituus sp.]|jgi:peptidyl-prolyl cis-trans isomerase D|uniref:SurA N-terminal domain-containing protein n=1 Tax=Thalassolituus sp. TaxID=2030822 RepID=UPI0027D51224|nr:SurA N-terminal domain-containing protein [Thalassolituus sp.]MDQ4424405.1 SurA N-terminal domain-containing protein [Thalassolituus sp.]MDQ4427058.1 SurA N-terminal domain-containing protein [Thalassolituus sp.]
MLQTMRNNAQGIIAKIIVGFIIVVFALWGVESIVNLGGGEKPVATVGDYEISRVEVQQKVAEQKNQLRRQFGDQYDDGLFNDKFLEQSAVEQLINEKVAQTQADKLDLYAAKGIVDQMIVNTPSFQTAGEYDPEQFKLVLRMNGYSVAQYRAMLADSVRQNQVRAAFMLSTIETPFEMQLRQSLENEQRTFSYASVSADQFKDSVEVLDDEITAYYDENIQRFMTPERARIRYVLLSRDSIENAQEVTEEDLEVAYQDYVADIEQTEQRESAHILFLTEDRSESEAIELAEAARARLDSGESFAAVAADLSEDGGSADMGGSLGVNPRGAFDPAFDDALYALEEGGVSEPVVTEFGVHIIKAVSVQSADVPAMSEVRDELVDIVKAEKAGFLFAERSQELANSAFSAETIEELAASSGLEVQTSDYFTQTSGQGVADSDQVRRTAFEDNMKLDRELSDLVDMESGSMVFVVDDYQDAQPKPLDEVRGQVVAALTSQKALEAASDKAKAILEGVADAEWNEATTTLRQSTEAPRVAQQKAFSLAEGESDVVSSPVGYTVVKLTSVDRKSWDDMAVTEELKTAVRNQSARDDMVSYQAWSKANTEIVQ